MHHYSKIFQSNNLTYRRTSKEQKLLKTKVGLNLKIRFLNREEVCYNKKLNQIIQTILNKDSKYSHNLFKNKLLYVDT